MLVSVPCLAEFFGTQNIIIYTKYYKLNKHLGLWYYFSDTILRQQLGRSLPESHKEIRSGKSANTPWIAMGRISKGFEKIRRRTTSVNSVCDMDARSVYCMLCWRFQGLIRFLSSLAPIYFCRRSKHLNSALCWTTETRGARAWAGGERNNSPREESRMNELSQYRIYCSGNQGISRRNSSIVRYGHTSLS